MKNLIVLFYFLFFCVIISTAQNQTVKGDLIVGESLSGALGDGSRLYFNGPGTNSDMLSIYRYNVQLDMSELRVDIGDDYNDRFVVGRKTWDRPNFTKMFVVHTSGKVGIMTENPQSTLDVNGTIRAKEVKIEATGWADFVFAPGYNLPSLSEVKKHIEDKQHLPNIPSASEVKENGVDLGEMQVKLLQKIEELTLYTIQQQKQLEEQSKYLEEQNKQIQELKQLVKNK